MEPKQTLTFTTAQAPTRPGISLTFSPKVTRAQLIENLDRILAELGCTGCGLNGADFIKLKADPFPEISKIKLLTKPDVLHDIAIEYTATITSH